MTREFNTTGTCIPELHYMADTSNKLNKIMQLIEKGKYFTINRPRQYGKTTTLLALEKRLLGMDYLVLSLSFEGMGDVVFQNEEYFGKKLINVMADNVVQEELSIFLQDESKEVKDLEQLSKVITKFIKKANKRVVLMIDEVDKSSNNQLFLSFLGMLRNKYLLRNAGKDQTFHSVILAGVHDVKTLKLKLRPDDERKYNSPWNIAAEFNVEMSLDAGEISTMLEDYCKDRNTEMDIKGISEKLYYYTSGYPFLVSRLCQIIDEKLMPEKWQAADVDEAFKMILKESSPNFDDLIKNLENNKELYEMVYDIIIQGYGMSYNIHNPVINLGILYGILKEESGKAKIQNKIYEQLIYDYMSSKQEKTNMAQYNFRDNFIENDVLDMEKVILKFQQFMMEQYSERDRKFLEREGRLVLLAFIKPIINGQGFDFKEVQISEERRLDVVITYLNKKYVLELKRWSGEKAHEKGLRQLKDYLDRVGVDSGYLVIFDFSNSRLESPASDKVEIDGKEIFMVRV